MIAMDASFAFSGKRAFNARFSVGTNDFTAFYGPSGSGKTTMLRILAGFTRPARGEIIVNGRYWFSSQRRINVPTRRRNIGFVFQDYALFPAMTVQKNMEFAAGRDRRWIDELLSIVELSELRTRYPSQLSGGQRQRLALARALSARPSLLLLDEPFNALDAPLRFRVRESLGKLHDRLGLTTIMASHEMSDIVSLAGKVVHFADRCIVSCGTPAEFFGIGKGEGEGTRMKGSIRTAAERAPDTIVSAIGNESFSARVDFGDPNLCRTPCHHIVFTAATNYSLTSAAGDDSYGK